VTTTKKLTPGTVGGIAGAIGAAIAFLVVSGVIPSPFGSNSVESRIEKFASETNKGLPIQIDQVTRWDRVEPGPGKAYSYIYTLSRNLTEAEKSAMIDNTTRKALAASDMQATFAAGVTVWYKYYDASGKEIFEFSVKK
jgi:hypothetical protein